MRFGYNENDAIGENEVAAIKFILKKAAEYSANPPADIVEAKIKVAKYLGEDITYEEAKKRVTPQDIEDRICDEVSEFPEYVCAIKEYYKRNGEIKALEE